MRAPVITDEMRGHGLTSPGDFPILVDPGQIVQVGAGATSHGLSTNADVLVSNELEVNAMSYFDKLINIYQGYKYSIGYSVLLQLEALAEEITIAVGNSTGVSAANLIPADAIILAVLCRVNQAPGAGPSNFDVGRTGGGNLDEYVDNVLVALAGRFSNVVDGDGVFVGPHNEAAADTITITTTDGAGTPVNVAGADMIVRVVVYYMELTPPAA